jgi:prepilin-type processing-associated H-X9-DG protein
MNATPRVSSDRRSQNAFTLTDLLVVLAVLALLICLRLPAFAKATNQTKRAQCASHLRQFTSALLILAGENNDQFPTTSVGFWPWDIPTSVGTFVESTGSKWTVMYCPGTSPLFTDANNWLLYNYTPQYRVVGYANTLPGNGTLHSTNVNLTLTPPSIQVGFNIYTTPTASERALLADATISAVGQGDPAQRYTYNYASIPGGFSPSHTSSHLSGRIPAGGNLGMLDGHVEWRAFAAMNPRTAGSSPVFWW